MDTRDDHRGRLWPSPDQELLLKAALLDGDSALDAFRAWRQNLDIDADMPYPVLRLLPLVYTRLQQLGVTDPLMGRLKGVYRRFWCENQTLFFHMLPTLRHLHQGGIELLMLKGAPFVASYYRNLALRPMADFDLAVRPEQLPRALSLLKESGWWVQEAPSRDDLSYFHALCCGRGPLQLDIHYHFLRECVTPSADHWFWSDSERLDFQGLQVRQLAPTALLFHTLVHGVRWNPESPVRWIADAVTLLHQRGDEVDWDRLLKFSDSQRLTHRLTLGLQYLERNFAIALPTRVRRHLQDYRPGIRETVANSAILRSSERLFSHPVTKQWVMFADYCGLTRSANPARIAWDFSHYLRYRWKVRGRLELLSVAGRGMLRRLRAS